MKRIFAFLLILAALLIASVSPVSAQVSFYTGGIPVLGTSNSVCLATNINYIQIKPVSLLLSGGTNAATSVTANLISSPTNSASAGVIVSTSTIAVGTNNFSTNWSATTIAITNYLYGQIQTGTNTENVLPIYGP